MDQALLWLPDWTGDALILLFIATMVVVAAWLWVLVWEKVA